MKNVLISLLMILFTIKVKSQCDAASLNSASPVTADNSGSSTPFVGIVSNEYVVLNGLIVNDSYTITSFDLAAPSTEAFITLRNTSDNSVIAFGNTPLTFEAQVTELEVHFFDESDCNPVFDLAQLSIQNESTLSVANKESITTNLYPVPVKTNLNIDSSTIIKSASIFNILGNNILSISPNKKAFEVNMSELKSGIYFLILQTVENKYISKKILKK